MVVGRLLLSRIALNICVLQAAVPAEQPMTLAILARSVLQFPPSDSTQSAAEEPEHAEGKDA